MRIGKRTRTTIVAMAGVAATLAIAACGGDDVGGGSSEDVQVAEAGPVEGNLFVSNWPAYIDPGGQGTVAEFEEKTGVSVKYVEDINSNLQFFGKLLPFL